MRKYSVLLGLLLALSPLRAATVNELGAEGERLAAYLDRQVIAQRAPGGSMLLVLRGRPVFAHGFGFADVPAGTPFAVDAPCRIASITKPMVAVVILRLVERGLLELDRPVDAWLPEFRGVKLADGRPAPRVPTLRECLNHRGGLRPMDAEGGKPWLRMEYRDQSMDAMIQRFAEWGLSFAPDTSYDYSGVGYNVAAVAAERATGRDFEALLQAELCGPLAMTSTSFFPSPPVAAAIPKMHRRVAGGWQVVQTRPLPQPGRYYSHAGEIISTPADVARFFGMIRAGGRVGDTAFLRPDSVTEMIRLPEPPRTRYGLGMTLGRPAADGLPLSICHTGSSGTIAWWDRQTDLIGVVFTQTSDPADAELLPTPEFLWRARYRADGPFLAGVVGDRQRIAVYRGPGAPSDGADAVYTALYDPAKRVLEVMTVDRIEDGGLIGFDAIVFPGGTGRGQSDGLGDGGRAAVRHFVTQGGGYVGICAGAYLACDGFSWGLGLLDARTVSDRWQRGVGDVRVELTTDGAALLGGPTGEVTIPYANGPVLAPNGAGDLPDYEPLAHFRTELAENNTPVGAMVGTPAAVRASYGAGRVVCFSPHPEKAQALWGWLERAASWACGDGAPFG